MMTERPDVAPERVEVEKLRAALRQAEAEVQRLLDEAAARGALVDILHDVMGSLSMGELFHMLARRLARALNLSHSSVIFAKSGDLMGTVASAHEDPQLENLQVELDKYPEIEAALASEKPVLIPDIWHSEAYKRLREAWEQDGSVISVRSIIALPFRLDLDRTGVFLLRRTADKNSLNQADVDFAETVVKSAMSAMRRAHMVEVTQADNVRLEALARTDPLTQLLNRRALLTQLGTEVERVRRYNAPLSILMIDVDEFKEVNDTYGHLAGDQVLVEVAILLARTARSVDAVARYGGDEFVIAVPETSEAGAIAFAERLRDKIQAHPFEIGKGEPLRLTVSIGVADFPEPRVETAEDLLDCADRALYRAKAGGRNLVCV
ncbi:MAG: sensor domain-containing diguanylate cyclase [Gemmatimonadota bacterium]|nr:sensor domain-containing diguanylate cyclase [Gemmatimonadota bacterium]